MTTGSTGFPGGAGDTAPKARFGRAGAVGGSWPCHRVEAGSVYVEVAGRTVVSVVLDGQRNADPVSEEGRRIVSSLEGPVRRYLVSKEASNEPTYAHWANAAREGIDRVLREGA